MSGNAFRAQRRQGQRRAAKQRPYPRRQPGEEYGYHFAIGVTHPDDASRADMCRITHDGAIAAVGDRRRSGISWRFVEGRDASRTWLQEYRRATGQPDESFADYEFFIDRVEDCVLVIAVCDVVM